VHDLVVLQPLGDFFEQDVVTDVVKISAQVYVHDPRESAQYRAGDAIYRLMALRLGRYPYEQSLKSASNIGSSISFSAPWTTRSLIVGMPSVRVLPFPLGISTVGWHWPVRPGVKLLPYPFQEIFKSLCFDVLKALSIDAGRAVVGSCQSIGFS